MKHFFKGQGTQVWAGSSGKAGLSKSTHSRAVLPGERGGKANPARRLAASTGLQSLPWPFVLCC